MLAWVLMACILGCELSSRYDMTHGITLALVTPAFLSYVMSKTEVAVRIVARLGRGVFDMLGESDEAVATKTLKRLKEFYKSLGMPENMAQAGVSEADLELLATNACQRPIGT